MSVSGNEIGDLLVDIGLITPEELENAHNEQSRTGERLSLVLEKLGLVSHNQLKDALELQYGVNYISLSKNPPASEIVALLPEELRRKHRVIPVSHHGTQYTIAMVDPDDIIAFDSLRLHLKSGQIKKVVCTADDFEFFIAKLDQEQEQASQDKQKLEQEVTTKPAAAKKGESKKTARKTLHSLFDDDDDDELEPVKESLTVAEPVVAANAAADLMQSLELSASQSNETSEEVEPAPVTTEVQEIEHSVDIVRDEPSEEPSLSLDSLTPIEAVVANVATHLADNAPTITGSPLLEEIVESEFASFSDSDFYESQISTKESYSHMSSEEELSRVLDMVLGDSDDLLEPLTPEERIQEPQLLPQSVIAEQPTDTEIDTKPEADSEPVIEMLASQTESMSDTSIDSDTNSSGDPLAELFSTRLDSEPAAPELEADTETVAPAIVPAATADFEAETPISATKIATDNATISTPEPIPVAAMLRTPADEIANAPAMTPVLAPVGTSSAVAASANSATTISSPATPSNGGLASQAITGNPVPVVDTVQQDSAVAVATAPAPAQAPVSAAAAPAPETTPAPASTTPAPASTTSAPAPAPAAAQPQPGEQLMSLARDIVSKAVQQKWSDIHLEPEQSTMSLRYFKSGELLADCKLPLQINQPLAGSYKKMAGLDARVSGRPQDKRFATTLNDITVELRVTTMPSDFGEMIAISIKYD
ncbi:MAG: hypothetical protein IPP57_05190 [Candidatus Obscuribacter sp.]|nr:hypothetical protein [Candidatus Obscuribacter sp.]MBL0187107.1 hypothetical protein [Candidatus Obscuribacter sp.]